MYDNVMSVLQNRWVQALGVLLALSLIAFLIYLVSPLLTPILLALLAAYLLFPLVRTLERWTGWKRFYIATGLMFIFIATLLLIPILLVPRVLEQADDLIVSAESQAPDVFDGAPSRTQSSVDRLIEWLPMKEIVLLMNWDPNAPEPGVPPAAPEPPTEEEDAAESADDEAADGSAAGSTDADPPAEAEEEETEELEMTYRERAEQLTEREAWAIMARKIGLLVRDNIANIGQQYATQVAGAIHAGGSTLAGILHRVWNVVVRFLTFLVNFSIFAFATVYLLVSYESLIGRTKELIPLQYKKKTLAILGKIDFQLRSFVRGQVVVAIVDAFVYCVGLSLAGVPFAVVIGLMAGFLSFVPYLGVLLGLIPSVLLVLVRHGLDWHILVVAATFMTVQTLEEVYLRPVVVGDKVGLHPVWVMASFLVFGNALGFLGILLAIPIAATLKVFVVEAYHYYLKSKLYRATGP